MKVLLIEDDETLRRTLCRSIRRMFEKTVEFLEASNYHDAIHLLTNNESYSHVHPEADLAFVLSDFNLAAGPRDTTPMNGGDVLTWIRANRPHLVQRFIFCSSDHRAKQLGVRCLGKPCDPEDFRRTILEIVH